MNLDVVMRPKSISDEDILRIAMECVLKEGPSISTMTIAERIGISQATLFKRFGSKAELLRRSLFLPLQVRKIFSILQKPEGHKGSDQLQYLYRHLYAFFDEMVPCWSMLHSAGIRFRQGRLEEKDPPIRARRLLETWIRERQELGEIRPEIHPEVAAIGMIGALQSRAFRKHIILDDRFHHDEEEFLSMLHDIFWRGLATDSFRDSSKGNSL